MKIQRVHRFFWVVPVLFSGLSLILSSAHDIKGVKEKEIIWIRTTCCDSKPAPLPSMEIPGDFESLTLPIKRAGRLILIEARIDTMIGNFIFDSGATGLVLNRSYFRQGTSAYGHVAGGVTGSAGRVERTTVGELQVSDLLFRKISADLANLGHIENSRGVQILGLFGYGLIRDFELVIDLPGNAIELHRIDEEGNRMNNTKHPHTFDMVEKVRIYSDIMFIPGNISGKKLLFCLDTGAESNVVDNHLPDKVLNTVNISRRSNLRGVGSHSVEVLYGDMGEFILANRNIEGMQTIITDLRPMGNAYGVQIDGVLGCDFFEKGIVCINPVKKELGFSFYRQ